jgi:Zinc-binding dehydrogenase
MGCEPQPETIVREVADWTSCQAFGGSLPVRASRPSASVGGGPLSSPGVSRCSKDTTWTTRSLSRYPGLPRTRFSMGATTSAAVTSTTTSSSTSGVARRSRVRRALTPSGTLVIVGGEGGRWTGIRRQLWAVALSPFVRQRLTMKTPRENSADLERLARLIEAGQLTPIVDKTYPLHQAADAIRRLEAVHARGELVITVPEAMATSCRSTARSPPRRGSRNSLRSAQRDRGRRVQHPGGSDHGDQTVAVVAGSTATANHRRWET